MLGSPRLLFWLMAALAIALDQASKLAVLAAAGSPAWRIEVTGFFDLVLVYNRGVSFGMLGGLGHAWQPYLLAGLAIAVAIGLAFWGVRRSGPWMAAALGLIAGGALGNAIDRLRIGAVVDFLDFHAAGYHWPAFNIADSALFLGVAYILWDGLFAKPTKSKTGGE